ncbi:MAG TPA: type II toxin-antitoxin system CcdA family antitoxin [Thermoanaerobaculia bacterium]|jgi:post-segregation antitoxin (ccd killing protein)|nr:type II toxin-antitoxin system CcdA family antitoxin [Thermoanaerobaculia bacterium]
MARVNIYLPDALAEEAKTAGLNVSKLAQEAVKSALSVEQVNAWLDSVAALERTRISHEDVLRAVREAKGDLDGGT